MKPEQMQPVWAFVSGVLFATGLMIGGMTQPAKVIGLMDFPGDWDPSLPFVMFGGIAAYSTLRWLMMRYRDCPTCEAVWHEPNKHVVDAKLIVGAALFGTGWGLSGFCPGPALASLGTFRLEVVVFVACMTGGMLLFAASKRLREAPGADSTSKPPADG